MIQGQTSLNREVKIPAAQANTGDRVIKLIVTQLHHLPEKFSAHYSDNTAKFVIVPLNDSSVSSRLLTTIVTNNMKFVGNSV